MNDCCVNRIRGSDSESMIRILMKLMFTLFLWGFRFRFRWDQDVANGSIRFRAEMRRDINYLCLCGGPIVGGSMSQSLIPRVSSDLSHQKKLRFWDLSDRVFHSISLYSYYICYPHKSFIWNDLNFWAFRDETRPRAHDHAFKEAIVRESSNIQ